MLIENMKMALTALRANKLRSLLTMLGIIIGIGSVISVVSIGDTMRKIFTDLYKDIGVTQGYISIGYWLEEVRESDYFTMDDIERIKEVFGDDLAYVDVSAYQEADVRNGRNVIRTTFNGIDYTYQDVQPVQILEGRYLSASDISQRRNNAVISETTAQKLFGSTQAVGKTFRVELLGEVRQFNVIGVYNKEMSPFQKMMMGVANDKGEAYIPWTLLTNPGDAAYQLHYFARTDMTEQELAAFTQQLTAYISRLKNRNPEDWFSYTAQEEMGQMDSMMAGISAAVGGIAAISLLVGGIGIMNIMLVSVTERTREIGIRKALGATTGDVLVQFLTESALLSALGGIIGIILAVALVSVGGAMFGIEVVVKPFVIIIAVAFSAVVGIFFGIYPAKKAAQKDPIIALRYE